MRRINDFPAVLEKRSHLDGYKLVTQPTHASNNTKAPPALTHVAKALRDEIQ